MSEPVREQPYRGHQCGCLLMPEDRCPVLVEHPDQALCDPCLECRHQDNPRFTFIPPGREVP